MIKFDMEAVAALLHIHEKALGHPKLKPLADAAQKQLEVVAADTAKQLEVEKAEEAEAARQAEEAARQEAVADEGEDRLGEQSPPTQRQPMRRFPPAERSESEKGSG